MKHHKVKDILPHTHSNTSKVVLSTARHLEDAEFVIKLDDRLKERGLTHKEFSALSGIRIGTISEMLGGSLTTFNKTRLITIMVALRITDITELIEIRLPADIEKQYKAESAEWIKEKRMPESVKEMYIENVTSGI